MKKLVALALVWAASCGFAFEAASPLLGTVDYTGGFLSEGKVKIQSKDIIRFFEVKIPSFCKNVEVLEAATITEGIKDEAKPVDGKPFTYAVNNGNGQRIESIVLTLNGPKDSSCTIPVYQSENKDPISTKSVLEFCNETRTTIHAAVAYAHQNQYVTEGWIVLPKKSCQSVVTTYPLTKEFYAHAFNASGMQWGADMDFCTSSAAKFVVGDSQCEKGEIGHSWRRFSRHPISATAEKITLKFSHKTDLP